ncbi:PRS4 [Enterospora canceri]|uniref:PRS4 n=1 Tax=Enterospora canceri TaxID=1081671 RepID=A0A1Y1S977_9MICR|nr:PRS4 [Enterospora canceri]
MGQKPGNIEKQTDNTAINLKRKKRVRDSKNKTNLPSIAPVLKCKLRGLKLLKIKAMMCIEDDLLNLADATIDNENKMNDKYVVDQLRGSPLAVGTLEEFVDDTHAIVSSPNGFEYHVNILSFVDKDLLEPGCTVLLNNKDQNVIGALNSPDVDPLVSVMKLERAPTETYADIGGLESQIQEIKESVELPLTHPELYQEMGIRPPKGVILYGEPGTGKTLLAKAVANQTSATFLRIVGSELIQKYMGDGPKLVREMFKVADAHAPSIIFIDEIDAIGGKRYNTTSSGGREIQSTMLELLNQLDGFDTKDDIKVIMATNKIENLDQALIRPGRIDRKIYFGLPDTETKRSIFRIHTGKMTLAKDVDLEELVAAKEELNGSDIKAICTEAGMCALRERRRYVVMDDFRKAKEKIFYIKKGDTPHGFYV